jgi:hypothetical protein
VRVEDGRRRDNVDIVDGHHLQGDAVGQWHTHHDGPIFNGWRLAQQVFVEEGGPNERRRDGEAFNMLFDAAFTFKVRDAGVTLGTADRGVDRCSTDARFAASARRTRSAVSPAVSRPESIVVIKNTRDVPAKAASTVSG